VPVEVGQLEVWRGLTDIHGAKRTHEQRGKCRGDNKQGSNVGFHGWERVHDAQPSPEVPPLAGACRRKRQTPKKPER
jgi:hypothetical protein